MSVMGQKQIEKQIMHKVAEINLEQPPKNNNNNASSIIESSALVFKKIWTTTLESSASSSYRDVLSSSACHSYVLPKRLGDLGTRLQVVLGEIHQLLHLVVIQVVILKTVVTASVGCRVVGEISRQGHACGRDARQMEF